MIASFGSVVYAAFDGLEAPLKYVIEWEVQLFVGPAVEVLCRFETMEPEIAPEREDANWVPGIKIASDDCGGVL